MALKITYTGDAKKAEAAAKALQKELSQISKEGTKTGKSLSQVEKQAQKLAEQADPMRKYNRQMKELADAVKRGGLNQQLANKHAIRYREELERIQKEGKGAFGPGMLSNLTKIGGALLAMRRAMREINYEWTARATAGSAFGTALVGQASSAEAFALNTLGLSDANYRAAQQAVNDIATKVGGDRNQIRRTVAATISAAQGTEAEKLAIGINAARMATQISPTVSKELSLGVADAMKAMGTQDAVQALGMVALSQTEVRVEDIPQTSKQLARAMNAAKLRGGQALTGARLFAALTAEGMDPTGDVSGAAAANVLNNVLPFARSKGLKASTPLEAMRLIASEGLGTEFAMSIPGEAKSRAAVEKVFQPGVMEAGAFDAMGAKADTPEERAQAVNRLLGRVLAEPSVQAARNQQRISNQFDILAETGVAGAPTETVEQVSNMLIRSGMTKRQVEAWMLGLGPVKTYEELGELTGKRAAQLQSMRGDGVTNDMSPHAGMGTEFENFWSTPESRRETAQLIEGMRDLSQTLKSKVTVGAGE